jgi:DTW domain-containing protein YfiP
MPSLEMNNCVESSPAYGLTRLSPQEQDDLLVELAAYLLKETYSTFAQSTLQKVANRTSLKYLSCQATLLQQNSQHHEAITVYEQIIE